MWEYHLQWHNCSPQCREVTELDDTQRAETSVYLIYPPIIANICAIIELGDPVEDLGVATVLMMVGGQLVLLRPRKVRKKHYIGILVKDLILARPLVRGSRSEV